LMDARATFLLGQAVLSTAQPNLSTPVISDDAPALGQEVIITTTVTDADRVHLNLRTAAGAPFTQLSMFDDGAHNDGAANDGTYGIAITLEAAQTEYYLYAENDNIGKFSPQRAEHEFYTISAGRTSVFAGELVINEFLASNDAIQEDQDGEFDDWIELYNNSDSAIDLAGFFLSDDPSNLNKWAFPEGTTVGAHQYLIVWADDDEGQEGVHTSFKLSAGGESVVLIDGDGAIIDSISFPEQATDISYGRYPNGTGAFREMLPTFGAENNEGTTSLNHVTQLGVDVEVYPNPTATDLEVRLQQAYVRDISVDLINTEGRLVLTTTLPQGSQGVTLAAVELPQGLYYLRLSDQSAMETHKIVLSR
ncbi:MAG: lamin tail domain-containing protein, partial [Bacteroidota bacterium]